VLCARRGGTCVPAPTPVALGGVAIPRAATFPTTAIPT
jgi:hypothetical protein